MRPLFEAGPHRLLVDGRPVAPVTVARTHRDKGRGLLGTSGVTGALWLEGTSSVHMIGMSYPIDVAVLDRGGVVLRTATLRPWTGMTWPRPRGRSVVEAAAGALASWGVRPDVRLSVADRAGQFPEGESGRLSPRPGMRTTTDRKPFSGRT